MPDLKDVFKGEPEPPHDPGFTEEEVTVAEVLPEEYQKMVHPLTLKLPLIKRDYKISTQGDSVSLKYGEAYELILRPPVDPPVDVADSDWPIATEYVYVFDGDILKGGMVYTYMADGKTMTLGDF